MALSRLRMYLRRETLLFLAFEGGCDPPLKDLEAFEGQWIAWLVLPTRLPRFFSFTLPYPTPSPSLAGLLWSGHLEPYRCLCPCRASKGCLQAFPKLQRGLRTLYSRSHYRPAYPHFIWVTH